MLKLQTNTRRSSVMQRPDAQLLFSTSTVIGLGGVGWVGPGDPQLARTAMQGKTLRLQFVTLTIPAC